MGKHIPEHRVEYDREYHAAHAEKRRVQRRAHHLKHRHGLTLEQWDEMFEAQGRCCAICGSTNPVSKQWHVDHNHTTGQLRAILCQPCNIALGEAREDTSILRNMIRYLERHNGKAASA